MKPFTTPCFIRKNTKELREKLEELGYEKLTISVEDKTLFTRQFRNGWFYCTSNLIDTFPKEFIDCSTNEPLFLAIAALREDNDYMQWFTDGEKWSFCMERNYVAWRDFLNFPDKDKIHKATVKELINFFK